MSLKSDTKSLELLIERFTEVSQQAKEMDIVVRNFGDVAKDLKDTIDFMEESFAIKEISHHSKVAAEKLKELKILNEAQMIKSLEEIVRKELSKQLKPLQSKIELSLQNSVTTQTQVSEFSAVLSKREISKGIGFDGDEDILYESNITKMAQLINRLNAKVKKIEEDYELRILYLEQEVEELTEQLKGTPIDISDDTLPF